LDKDVVNPSQIRTVIKSFKDALFKQLFPRRKEVPKTLIFAKTDSHADDIIKIVREEFGEGNEFCRKITYSAANPEEALSALRNDFYPRIAVTVDMIATGTDVKPLECLIFMRDVRSKNYFEQMKGRGTRTLEKEDLQKVTPSATDNKDHFVIIDAVGVTQSRKTETRTLERKPSVSLKELMMNIALGARDEDTLTSLSNRIIRLNSQMSKGEKKTFETQVGISAGKLAEDLLNAFDEDILTEKAQEKFSVSEPTAEQIAEVKSEEIKNAVQPILNPEGRECIENIRRSHEQIIDNVNLDTVTFAGFDTQQTANAERVITTFKQFIEENKDELLALRIIYSQPYKDRPMVIAKLKELYAKLTAKGVTTERLWDCYGILKPEKVKRGTMAQLTDLISLVRFELGYADKLEPFSDRVNYNFMQWTLKRNAGAVHFTEEQMEWLRLIKDHIVSSLSIVPDDLDYTPFDHKGGLGRFFQVFGEQYEAILNEMNEVLVA
jgi:type I restriction enzyme R subunit